MGNSHQPEFDRQSLDALRSDLAKMLELRSELVTEDLTLHVGATGEAILEIMTRYQEQTLRALVLVGFSLGAQLVTKDAHSPWGIASALIAFCFVFFEYLGFTRSKKQRKVIEHVDLIRSMARGIDNFRQSTRQKLLRACEVGDSSSLDKTESDLYRKLRDEWWKQELTEALCPALSLGWHSRDVRSDKYGRFGPVYDFLCDQLLSRDPILSKWTYSEEQIREVHKACFGEQAHKNFVGGVDGKKDTF